MLLPLALGNAWVGNLPWGVLKFSRGMLMASIVMMGYSILAIWISPSQDHTQGVQQQPTSEQQSAPPPVTTEANKPANAASKEPPRVTAPTDTKSIQLDASVTLSSRSFDESCGMWISIGYGTGKLLAPANVAADLRATNLTDHPVRILEILGTVGEDPTKSYLYRLPFYETKLILGDLKSPGALHQLVSTTTERSLSFQENAANPIPARKSIDGWVLFEYPGGLTGVDARSVRFIARTDYGDIPVSGIGMGTFTGGGAHFKPLPDAIDFREYHVERYSTFIKRPPTP